MELFISCSSISNDDLIESLESRPEWDSHEMQLELRRPSATFRSLEPTVVVAIVSGSATVVGALLTYLLTVAKEKDKGEIFVKVSNDDVEVRLPTDADQATLNQAVEVIERLRRRKAK
jgi:hypothetical protein